MINPNQFTPKKEATLKEIAYNEIKNAIVMQIIPGGAELEEALLARQFNMSRTPVREALRALEQEGLVTISRGKGAFVSKPSWKELSEIFVIRETIESLAARLAAQNMDEQNIYQLEQVIAEAQAMFSSGDYESMLVLDAKFHGIINECCGNRKLSEIIEMLTNQARLNEVKISSWRSPGSLEQSLREHNALLHAIKIRDKDAAEKLMKEHGHRFINEAVRHWGTTAQ